MNLFKLGFEVRIFLAGLKLTLRKKSQISVNSKFDLSKFRVFEVRKISSSNQLYYIRIWVKKKKRCKNFIITRFHVKKGMFFWNPSGADLFFVKKFLNSYPRDCKTIHVDRNCVMMHWQWRNKPQKVKIEKVSKKKSSKHSYQIIVYLVKISYIFVSFWTQKIQYSAKLLIKFLKLLKTN